MALATIRQRQIASLFQYNSGVQQLEHDARYVVPCATPSGEVRLTVYLSPLFPQGGCPVVTVSPPVRHAWVDDRSQVTGCQALRGWHMHAILGQAVLDVVRQFQSDPPQILDPSSSRTSGPAYQPPSMPSYNQYGPPGGAMQLPQAGNRPAEPPQQVDLPPVPSSFPELADLSSEELQKIGDNDASYTEFFQGLQYVADLKKGEEELRTEIEKLARQNLSREPDLSRKKQELAALHAQLQEKKTSYDQNLAKQAELATRYAPDSILTTLKIATQTAEEEAEDLAATFKDGDMTIVEFIKAFQAKKKLHHLRKAKEEQLSRTIYS